jgi:hypothetical protein
MAGLISVVSNFFPTNLKLLESLILITHGGRETLNNPKFVTKTKKYTYTIKHPRDTFHNCK